MKFQESHLKAGNSTQVKKQGNVVRHSHNKNISRKNFDSLDEYSLT